MSEIRPRLWTELESTELLAALADPPDTYRPVPWLAWSGELDWPVLRGQLADMLDKGITEFFLFPLYGMELPYMSAAYWERVHQTLEFCRDSGMKCWIYDEYNWPSGTCAGRVLRDHPEARSKFVWVRRPDVGAEDVEVPPGLGELNETAGTTWAIQQSTAVRISSRGCDWLSLIPGYLDVLSMEANRHFIEYTHERYFSQAPQMFPVTIPGFFTDEPATHTQAGKGWLAVPFTDDLFDSFLEQYGYDLRERLGDLAVDGADAVRTRCHYWRWVAERFGEAYSAQQRAWCDRHGVALTGHALGEETLIGQVAFYGDMWEVLKHLTIPGIDLLANADGFNHPYRTRYAGDRERRSYHLTCKYVHGVTRHSGGREMMSEAYGVCDWGMNLFRQKCGFNYQVALGVTLFNDNSLITSIADFRKYAIAGKHFTQPWWAHYRQYADYNARLAALHAEGEPVAEIAVLFPRSTVWALTNADAFDQHRWAHTPQGRPLAVLQEQLYDLLDEMIRQQWHFDMVFEPVLSEATVDATELVTRHARYRAVVVPSASVLPRQCVQVLRQFAQAGGMVIFAGDLPQRDAVADVELLADVKATLAADTAHRVGDRGTEACETLREHLRPALVLQGDGAREFISSRRRLAGSDIIFVANMAEAPTDVTANCALQGPVVVCDPDTLECFRPDTLGDEGSFTWHFEPWQAFLLLSGEAASAVASEGELLPEPAWLHPTATQVLDGEWDFAVEPGNMLRLTLQVRPDPENQGAADDWQNDRQAEGWIETEEGRLPEPIAPANALWYWMRARVICDAGSTARQIVVDNPDSVSYTHLTLPTIYSV